MTSSADAPIDWTQVREGDEPDPTRAERKASATPDKVCPAESPDEWQWLCTRALGHDGPHVAGTSFEVAAVWS